MQTESVIIRASCIKIPIYERVAESRIEELENSRVREEKSRVEKSRVE